MKSAKKMKIICFSSLFVLVLIIFYLSLGKVIGHFVPSETFSKLLKEKNGLELSVDKLKFKTKINLSLTVNFDNLKISTPEKKELVNLGKSGLEIKILPLITKRIKVQNFHSESAKLNILREKNGMFELEKYFSKKGKIPFKFAMDSGKITNYEIIIQDDLLKTNSEIQGQNLTIQNTKSLFELKTNGQINAKDKDATYEIDLKTKLPFKKYLATKDFRFNMAVNNLDISQYSSYLKYLKHTKGNFYIKISTNEGKIAADIDIKNFEIPDEKFRVKADSDLKITTLAHFEDDFIEFENLCLEAKKIHLTAKGKILNYKNNKPELDFLVSIEDTNGKSLIALLPDIIPTPQNSIYKLKKYTADGTLNAEGSVTGKAKRPDIVGKGYYKDVTILNKQLKIPTSGGDIEFFGDWAKMNARAFVGNGKYIDVIGSFGLYRNRDADFKIISNKNVDIKNAQILVLPIQDIIGFKLGPVPVMDLAGSGAIDLKVVGNKTSAVLDGYFEFNNAKVSIEDFYTPAEQCSGKILFKKDKITFNNIKGKINTADLQIDGTADLLGNVDMKFSSKNMNNKDIWRIIKDNFEKDIAQYYAVLDKIKLQGDVVFGFKHKFDTDDIYQKVALKDLGFWGRATGVNYKGSDVNFNSGDIVLKNNKVYFNKLDFNLFGADIVADFIVDKVFDLPPQAITNGEIVLKNFGVEKINDAVTGIGNKNLQNILDNFKNFSGKMDGTLFIKNNNFSGKLDLEGIQAVDNKNVPIKINTGNVEIKNDKLSFNKLNMNYGTIPLYVNANVANIHSKNSPFDLQFSTSLSEDNVDTFINSNLVYPIKVKGEIALKGMLKGTASDYKLYLKAGLEPQNDISYMGANLGDKELKRELRTNINFKKNIAKVNNLEYLKYISSQNNKLTPVSVLKTSGEIILVNKKDATLKNFNIKTQNPATAKIFNIIFKKSILKQGQFSCDLVLNGNYDNLKILGDIDFSDINIPLYGSKIQDAQFNFKNNLIQANLSGKMFESDVKTTAEIVNDLKFPIVIKNIDIQSVKSDIGKIIDELSLIGTSQRQGSVITTKDQIIFGPNDVVVENGSVSASEVNLYDISTKNFSSRFKHLLNEPFKFYDTIFDIAGGKIISDGTFDFQTTKLTLNSQIKDCEASVLSQNFFGISNQIFGKTNGEMHLTGSKLNTPTGLKTVGANATFNIENGKMPKLGSLEYLIRAGNVYKSGILGLTINNIIEVLVPYKTGDFARIKGSMLVQDGIIENLEIKSKGENLSLFINGKYDLTSDTADIKIFGRLSKKVSNLLGPIGNASFNSIFDIFGKKNSINENELIQNMNRIPLIEISQEDYRIFMVKIVGDLNKEGYVKTFNWLN